MKNKAPRFPLYHLDKFILEAFKNISPDNLSLLTNKDREHIVYKSKFIETASLQEKLMLLAKCGYPFCITIADRSRFKYMSKPAMQQAVGIFFNSITFKRREAEIYRQRFNLVFISDIRVIKGMMCAAHMDERPIPIRYEQELKSAEKIDRVVARAMATAHNKMERGKFKGLFGITHMEYIALSVTATKPECTLPEINKISPFEITMGIMSGLTTLKMVDTKYVYRQRKTRPSYWITGYGEMVLQKARKYFVE